MKKVYSAFGVRIGTFIGGPLTGGYLLSQNFKAIGRADLARKTLMIVTIFTLAFLAMLAALPKEVVNKIPGIVFPLLFVFLSNRLFDRYQKEAIEHILEKEEGTPISNWMVAGISLLFALATFSILLLFIFGLNPEIRL